jgi:hypothetical protein
MQSQHNREDGVTAANSVFNNLLNTIKSVYKIDIFFSRLLSNAIVVSNPEAWLLLFSLDANLDNVT